MSERDLAWEAMVEVCGYHAPVTETERGRINSALKELRKVYPDSTMYAIAVDVRARAEVYLRKFPGMELTPQALVGNWSRLDPSDRPAITLPETEKAPRGCETCNGDGIVLYQVRSDGSEEYAPCPDCVADHTKAGFWRHYNLKEGESMRYNPPEPAKVRAAMLRLLEPEAHDV